MENTILSLFAALAVNVLVNTPAAADFRGADVAAKEKDWARVARECSSDAEAGEKNCQAYMGKIYKEGLGLERNLPLSAELLRKCAVQGQSSCEEMLGDSYRRGVGVAINYEEALKLFRSAAEKGNSWAFNNLGEHYRFGQGVPRNVSQAARYYRLAADKGNPLGQANLADLHRLGDGVEKDGDAAFQLALKSSQQNFGAGWNMLGLLYRDGIGVRRDARAAIDAFKKAFDPGVTYPVNVAFANLAKMYYLGLDTAVDWDEAARWAEAGARANQRDCLLLLANILARGGKSVRIDKERAFQLAQRAHEFGAIGSKNTLGYFFRDGIGTPVDFTKAHRLLSEAIEVGDFNAAVNLGIMHLEGMGMPKDAGKAHEYFMLAQARTEALGPGTRRYVESYFSSRHARTSPQGVTPMLASPSNPTSGASVTLAPAPENTQQALLERMEKMQKQLELLQASSNTINMHQLVERSSQTAVRRALVIGNDRYQHVQPLMNAREDASAIASALRQLGFAVSVYQDVDEKKFKQVLREFRSSLDGGEEVLFFFAGHGVQLGSANYLLPTDIKGDNEEQVKDEAIELQRILDDLKSKNSKFALAIVDACRDNPFKKSGRAIGGRGLAPTTAATGQMVMFSAGAGQQALDKLGNSDTEKNGVFTRVLLKEMLKPGVPVDRVLRNVRNEVVRLSKAIGHEQTPALYDQAVGDFYFSLR